MSKELTNHHYTSSPTRIQRAASGLFHLARYFVAASVTGLALVALPLVVIVAVTGLIAVFLILAWIAFFLGAPLDGGAIQAIFWFIIAPLSLLLSTAIASIEVVFLVVMYIAVGVLPFCVLVELIFLRSASQRLSVAGVLARLLAFAAAGVVPGVASGVIGFVLVQPQTLLGTGAVCIGAILPSVCAVFLCGLVLTLLEVLKEGGLALWRRATTGLGTA
jgi:hypothetical protein